MTNLKQTPIKLSDFEAETKNPHKKNILLLSSFLGVVALFLIFVVGINLYVFIFRKPATDQNVIYSTPIDSAIDELSFIDTQNQFKKDKSIDDILNERMEGIDNAMINKSIQKHQILPSKNEAILIQESSIVESSNESLKETITINKDIIENPKTKTKESSTQITKKDKKAETTKPKSEPFFVYRDYSVSKFVPGSSKHIAIPITSVIEATLLTDLNSLSVPSIVLAKITHTSKNMTRFKGCTLLGKMRSDLITKKIFIDFHSLILENNDEIRISAIAQDNSGNDGLEATVNKNMNNNLIKEGLDKGFELLNSYVGGSSALDAIQSKNESDINTDIILTINKNKNINIFFQQSVEI